MQVSQVMTRGVCIASPSQTIGDVAKIMAEGDLGAVPVSDNDRLVGMITDRDIAVRAVALGKSPKTKVGEVMSRDVKYCFEDEDIAHVAENMGDIQMRRLPVVTRDKKLVGIIALADIASREDVKITGSAVRGISADGGSHSGMGSH